MLAINDVEFDTMVFEIAVKMRESMMKSAVGAVYSTVWGQNNRTP